MSVLVAGQEFSDALLEELQEVGATCSRRQLARLVCERLAWQSPTGGPPLMSARKALADLGRRGVLPLPDCAARVPAAAAITPFAPPVTPLPTALPALGQVRLVLIGGRRSQPARLWREIMAHHYLGAGPLCGAQLRYLIASEAGYLGARAFSAAALKLQARDAFIGWTEEARRHQLHQVVNNSRFLLLPWVQVPHLASHVLGQCARQLGDDWQERYGYRPVLLESFVDTERFAGTSYKAAGWQCLGETSGRGRQDRAHQAAQSRKAIWLKALEPDWQAQLCRVPEILRLASPPKPLPLPPPPASDWAEAEMRGAALGDERLSRRLVTLTRQFFARPQANLPEACGERAAAKAAYRFFEHPDVNLPKILAPHREQTIERAAQQKVVLAVQDTSELDYTAHPLTEGLGPIGNHRPHVHGLILHPTMAYTSEGVALGLLDVQCWKRDPEQKSKFRRPIEEKESYKWLQSFAAAQELQQRCPGTLVVSVGDREADLFELFQKAAQCPHGTKFLVRAFRKRALPAEAEDDPSGDAPAPPSEPEDDPSGDAPAPPPEPEDDPSGDAPAPPSEPEDDVEGDAPAPPPELWASLLKEPDAGTVELSLPRRGNRKARVAIVSLRFAEVTLPPPAYLRGARAVTLWAVALTEETPPEETPPVQWLLLTNLPVTTLEEAVEKTRWYGQRFQIEVFFRTLKSGCRIEDRQLGHAQRLENCLAIDLVVAWRIVHLVKLGREVPDVPCTIYFEEMQWQALVACTQRASAAPALPPQPPTLREAIRMVAQLGGFLGRKGDGEPGAQTLWRGLQRLDDIVIGFGVALRMTTPPVPSKQDYG
jgi:hypothetical protein